MVKSSIASCQLDNLSAFRSANPWSDVPPIDASVIKSGTFSGQLDNWSAFESG